MKSPFRRKVGRSPARNGGFSPARKRSLYEGKVIRMSDGRGPRLMDTQWRPFDASIQQKELVAQTEELASLFEDDIVGLLGYVPKKAPRDLGQVKKQRTRKARAEPSFVRNDDAEVQEQEQPEQAQEQRAAPDCCTPGGEREAIARPRSGASPAACGHFARPAATPCFERPSATPMKKMRHSRRQSMPIRMHYAREGEDDEQESSSSNAHPQGVRSPTQVAQRVAALPKFRRRAASVSALERARQSRDSDVGLRV